MRIIKVLTATLATATVIGGVPAVQASVAANKQPPPTFDTTIKQGRKAARSALKQTKSTSVSVALVSSGKTVWSQTFGRVNAAGKKPSPTTMYGVGSVSKTVTAIAVMQLVDAGKVSLDAPVVRYIPDFTMASPQYKQITVRMLLNHSAGLPGTDYADALSYKPIPSYVDRVLSGLRTSHLKTTPGAMNVYCNDCYTLAGLVVERVSGLPYQDYVAKNVFKPLGMKHSTYASSVPAPGAVAPVLQGGKAQPFQITNIFASGGLLSTSDDMARLAMIFTGDGVVGGKRIISSSAVEQMGADQTTTTLKAAPPNNFRYGLGWDTVEDPALKSVGVRGWTKGGDIGQYHAGFVIAPDQGLAVVVEGAGTTFSSTGAETIAQTVLLNALVETGAIKKMPKPITGKPTKDKATPKQVKKMTGIFLAQNLTLKVVEGENRSLRFSLLSDGKWARQPGRFVRRADGAFWATKTPGASISVVKAWGRTYLTLRGVGGTGTFRTHATLGQRMRSGACGVADLAGEGGAQMVVGQRGSEFPELDERRNTRRGYRDHPRLVRLPPGRRRARRIRSLRRHGQRQSRHDVPRGSAGTRSGPVRPRLLHAGRGGVPHFQQQRPAACRDGSQPVRWQQCGHHRCEGFGRVVPGSQRLSGDHLWPERLEALRRHVVDTRLRRRRHGDEAGAGRGLPGSLRPGGEHRDGGGRVGRVEGCPSSRGWVFALLARERRA